MKIFQSWMGRNELEKYCQLFPEEPLNILISFAHGCGNMLTINCLKEQGKINLLMSDSGTYTVKKWGRHKYPHVTKAGYQSYMTDYHTFFDIIINFDEDHSTNGFETNYPNQLDLEDAGIPVVPVVQNILGEEIETYLEDGSGLIAFGSSQIKKPKHLEIVFKKLTGYRTKVHLLGKTEYKFLIRQPLFSADSSSAMAYARKGILLFWNNFREADNNGDRTDMINLEEHHNNDERRLEGVPISTYPYRNQLEQYILDDFGVTLGSLGTTERNLMKKVINMRYYKILEKKVTECHFNNGWVDENGEILTIK